MIRSSLIFLFLLISFSATSQSSRIVKFTISPTHDNKVLVVWTMNAGSTCLDLAVEKSLDGNNYHHAYTYPSVCGSSDREITYSWVDPTPKLFAVNHYRLNLEDVEYTLPRTVDLQSLLVNKSIISYPNPSNGNLTVEFRNSANQEYTAHLFDNKGTLIQNFEKRSGKKFQINTIGMKNGVYSIRVIYENDKEESIRVIVAN